MHAQVSDGIGSVFTELQSFAQLHLFSQLSQIPFPQFEQIAPPPLEVLHSPSEVTIAGVIVLSPLQQDVVEYVGNVSPWVMQVSGQGANSQLGATRPTAVPSKQSFASAGQATIVVDAAKPALKMKSSEKITISFWIMHQLECIKYLNLTILRGEKRILLVFFAKDLVF